MFCALPGFEQLGDQVLGEHTVPGGPCILVNPPVPTAQFPGWAKRAPSQVCHVSPLGSWSQAATLLANDNCPVSHEDMVSSWEPAHSLVENADLWGRDCPLPSCSGCCTPASLPMEGEGLACIWLALLWCSVNPLFCERARLWVRLEPFVGKFFFFSPLWLSQSLGCYLPLALFDGPHPVLTLSMQPTPPCPAPAGWWQIASVWATSPLGVADRCILCVFFFFFFFPPSYVALWDSKTPHRPAGERVSCYLETSPPSWLPPQVGSPSLNLLSLIFCPVSFQREWAAFMGAWCPLPAFRSCFVEVAQHSNDPLVNLRGRKWSPHPIPWHLGTTPLA